MARFQDLEIDVHTSVGIVRPGDKLVIAIGSRMTDQEADRMKNHIQDQLPGVSVVLVEAEALVVYRR